MKPGQDNGCSSVLPVWVLCVANPAAVPGLMSAHVVCVSDPRFEGERPVKKLPVSSENEKKKFPTGCVSALETLQLEQPITRKLVE